MAKSKGGDKGGGKAKGGKEDKKEVKGAQSINVRHILVRIPLWCLGAPAHMSICEAHCRCCSKGQQGYCPGTLTLSSSLSNSVVSSCMEVGVGVDGRADRRSARSTPRRKRPLRSCRPGPSSMTWRWNSPRTRRGKVRSQPPT